MSDWEAWGIEPGYHDVEGGWHATSPETAAALLAAMGATHEDPWPRRAHHVRVLHPGQPLGGEGPWDVTLEDGGTVSVDGRAPAELPLGYHRMLAPGGEHPVRLIVTPEQCHLPSGLRTWGWAAQLYALRSATSWGIGDLADLRRFGRFAAGQGAGMCLVNPLHAPLPTAEQQDSPYSPSSRCWRNPLYLRVEEVPGAAHASVAHDLAAAAAAGRALTRERRVDRNAVWSLKRTALEAIWRTGGPQADAGFAAFCRQAGDPLAGYAAFCALTDEYGAPWTAWPAPYRRRDHPAVAEFAEDHADRVGFHQWLQWLLDEQLKRAGGQIGLMQDLAIGLDPAGADAWYWPDCVPDGVRVGAPPDEFNRHGQDWGLAPFDPWALGRAGYEPFIQTVRAGFRYAGGLRFDHVMGLFRLFCIPPGGRPADGAYVRYPAKELLDILALESVRAGAYVVGEDLGTVQPGVREELGRRRVLSYRLLWFEPERPAAYPELALAAVATHDLPTVAGLWTGADLRAQAEAGLEPNPEATDAIRRRLRDWGGLNDDAPPEEAVAAAYRLLATAPSALVSASLDDALVVEERPNMPGTVDEWPNWSIALPLLLEELEQDPRVAALARMLNGR